MAVYSSPSSTAHIQSFFKAVTIIDTKEVVDSLWSELAEELNVAFSHMRGWLYLLLLGDNPG